MIILKGAKSLCYNTSNKINIARLAFLLPISVNIGYLFESMRSLCSTVVQFSYVKQKARWVSKGYCGEVWGGGLYLQRNAAALALVRKRGGM